MTNEFIKSNLNIEPKTARQILLPIKIYYPDKNIVVTIPDLVESIKMQIYKADKEIKLNHKNIYASSVELELICKLNDFFVSDDSDIPIGELGYLKFNQRNFDNICGYIKEYQHYFSILRNDHLISLSFCGILGDFTKEINGGVIDKKQEEIVKQVRKINRRFTF